MNELVPLSDIDHMADVAAKSKMFGFKSKDEALAIMLLCQAEGMHPAIAMRDYNVIQGRPALKADAMLARYLAAGGKVKWNELTDKKVSATFTHAAGGEATITWTFEDAKKIGLTGKDNWVKYPRAMLRSRVVSEGIRTTFPGVIVGVYTPEEVADMSDKPDAGPEIIRDPVPELVVAPGETKSVVIEVPVEPKKEPGIAPAASETKPAMSDRDFARHTFDAVKSQVANAKDSADIDEVMKANKKGLKVLEDTSPANYARLREIVKARRDALIPEFE